MFQKKLFFIFSTLCIFFLYFLGNLLIAQEERIANLKTLYKNKEYKKIVEQLEEEVENSKDLDLQVYFLYSYSLWNLGDKEEAIDSLYLALKRKPSPEVFSQLVKAYSSNLKYKGALEICEAGLKKFPDDAKLNLQRGYLLAKFRKTNEALRVAEGLKSKYPNDPKPLVLEAHIYSLRKDWEKAQIALEWANSLEANNPIYKNNLAVVYEKSAENEKQKSKVLEYLTRAKDTLEQAIKISPSSASEVNLKRIQEKLSQIQ